MSAACTPGCGYCGMCTAVWEREEDDDQDDRNIEVCPDCLGSGEVTRCDGSDRQVTAICLECNGKGYLSESTQSPAAQRVRQGEQHAHH